MQWLVQQPMPAWIPGCDGEALPGYKFIKGGFKLCTFTFYNGIHVHGASANLPPVGSPTIICFNHSNGLADPMVMIRACPRMVRFVAKDNLWNAPVIGNLIKATGAVPVQRKEEHGNDADCHPMFGAVTDALEKGQCIGIAPEGNSKMRTMLDVPIKPGVGLMAVEAVFRHMSDDKEAANFAVHIVPCGLVYLNREKMRSEVLVNYGKPVVVDANFLRERGVTSESSLREARRACVNDIMEMITAGLESSSLTASPPDPVIEESQTLEGDWRAFGPGITATRIHLPGKTEVPLNLWAGAVKDFSAELAKPQNRVLSDRVRGYQRALYSIGLPDEFIRRREDVDTKPPGVSELALEVIVALALLVLSLPGLFFWLPVMALCYSAEGVVVLKGTLKDKATDPIKILRCRRNFDTIAERKMTIGFVGNTCVCCAVWAFVWFWRGFAIGVPGLGFLLGWIALPILMWITIRLLEEASACTRSARAIFNLLRLEAKAGGSSELAALLVRRSELGEALGKLLPTGQPRPLGNVPAQWNARAFFGLKRRYKMDWYESMSLVEDLGFINVHEKRYFKDVSPPK